MTQTQTQDVIAVLIQDHREVEEMFVRLEELNGDANDEAKTVAEQVVIELVRHSVAEEQYVYPAAREHLPNGDQLTDHEIKEHSEAERTMKKLEKLDPSDAEFWPTVTVLIQEIRHHVAEEEGKLFPELRAACPHDKLLELGGKVTAAKKIAPTRPHPTAPDHPPMNKVLGPGTGLVDRMRDALTGRGKS